MPAANRSPAPARGTPAVTVSAPPTTRASGRSGSGGQNLVEDDLGLRVVGVLSQRQLTDEDLPGLGQHALLASGQAAFLIAAPQVAHHLGDLVHVTGGQLLQVRLVTARPVGRLLGV